MRIVLLFLLSSLWLTSSYGQQSGSEQEQQIESTTGKKYLIVAKKADCLTCDLFIRTLGSAELMRIIGRHYNKEEINFPSSSLITTKPSWASENGSIADIKRKRVDELLGRYDKQNTTSPMIIILDEQGTVLQMFTGLIPEHKLKQILTYYANDFHLKLSWEKYKKSYNKK